jgi:hypothetical protein
MNDFDYGPEYFFCLHISNDAYQRCQWNHSFFFRRHLTFPPFPMVRVYRKEFLSEKKCIFRNKICCAALERIDD